MNNHLLADTGGALIIYILLFDLVLITLLYSALVLVESIVLRVLKWGTFWRSLLASALMNPLSTVVGFALLFMIPSLVSYSSWLELWIFLLISWVLSIAIEGGVLVLMKRDGGRKNWTAAFVANTASYVLLIAPSSMFLHAGLIAMR